ncbi:hypothetical protein [Sporolactobacillus shoreicorticis]|uniref:Uncharacterized protein n=1 Tax=Sporolactobacillus shoreicorticis TaxID=1923877 RepID=A0ABW5S250_9BACL
MSTRYHLNLSAIRITDLSEYRASARYSGFINRGPPGHSLTANDADRYGCSEAIVQLGILLLSPVTKLSAENPAAYFFSSSHNVVNRNSIDSSMGRCKVSFKFEIRSFESI